MIQVWVDANDWKGTSPLSQLPRGLDSRSDFEVYQRALREQLLVLRRLRAQARNARRLFTR